MPELRKNPFTDEWLIVGAGEFEKLDDSTPENCPLCPGNEHLTDSEIMAFRPNNAPTNARDWWIRSIPSKNPILQLDKIKRWGVGIYDCVNNKGANEIVIITPEHGKRMSELSLKQIADMFWAYRERIINLKEDAEIKEIFIYHAEPNGKDNKMHARSHIYGLPVVSPELEKILSACRKHYKTKQRCLFCDAVRQAKENGLKIIRENIHFLSFMSDAPRKDYEVIVVPQKHHACFEEFISDNNIYELAEIVSDVLRRYEATFNHSSRSFVLHTAPNIIARSSPDQWLTLTDDFHWCIIFLPLSPPNPLTNFHRLTGISTIKDMPEEQAKILREAII